MPIRSGSSERAELALYSDVADVAGDLIDTALETALGTDAPIAITEAAADDALEELIAGLVALGIVVDERE